MVGTWISFVRSLVAVVVLVVVDVTNSQNTFFQFVWKPQKRKDQTTKLNLAKIVLNFSSLTEWMICSQLKKSVIFEFLNIIKSEQLKGFLFKKRDHSINLPNNSTTKWLLETSILNFSSMFQFLVKIFIKPFSRFVKIFNCVHVADLTFGVVTSK